MSDINLFSLWTPIDLEKAASADDDGSKAPIAGIVSTDSKDLQGDMILQDGCDWSYFLTKGWFNYEHKQGPENIVGIPESVQPMTLPDGRAATRVKGYLLIDRPQAKEVYEAAKAIQKSGGGRSIGFSVEGQVLERDKRNANVITKARILNVSVTAHPVNPDARLEVLARSLDAVYTTRTAADNGDAPMAVDIEKGDVGYQAPSQPDASAALSSLVPESLEGKPSEVSEPSEDLSSMIEGMLRRVLKDEMQKMMNEDLDRVMDSAKAYTGEGSVEDAEKSADARPPMISFNQMSQLMGKVFPQIPQSEQRAMARKLLSAAKGYKL
jgi:hypothetical protein